MSVAFHHVRLQDAVNIRAGGSLEYSTQIFTSASGFEHRNGRWAQPRRRYALDFGTRRIRDLRTLSRFFRARKGRLHGFLWRDQLEYRSHNRPGGTLATDQPMQRLRADGRVWAFYKGLRQAPTDPRFRRIFKPVAASVRVAHRGQQIPPTQYVVHAAAGVIVFAAAHARTEDVTAGFEFDVPVRFDADQLEIQLTGSAAGTCAPIALVELRLPELTSEAIAALL